MDTITIVAETETQGGWTYKVEVGDPSNAIKYFVTLDKSYFEKLAGENNKPADLVRRSFEFLLKREPKESILRSFNLRVINDYFPEYEEKISSALIEDF